MEFCPCCWKYHDEAEIADRMRIAFRDALSEHYHERKWREDLEEILRSL